MILRGQPFSLLSPADYERARACVNACAGISAELLSHGPVAPLARMSAIAAERDEIAGQYRALKDYAAVAIRARDDLAAALRRFMDQPAVREATQSTDIGLANAADQARAALAKVKP